MVLSAKKENGRGTPTFGNWRVRFREGAAGAREGRLARAVGFSVFGRGGCGGLLNVFAPKRVGGCG